MNDKVSKVIELIEATLDSSDQHFEEHEIEAILSVIEEQQIEIEKLKETASDQNLNSHDVAIEAINAVTMRSGSYDLMNAAARRWIRQFAKTYADEEYPISSQ